jgi:CRP-like cAMP-binding protein/Fe-S-cluster-containing hydrogenase component 2
MKLDFHTALNQKVQADIMACIGCNDCMLACPLPETGLVSIAELNFAVNQSTITNPNVIQFVNACTQCRQCVPVCPADLSRADMVLFNKLKIQDVAPDRYMRIQAGSQVEESGWTLDKFSRQISGLPIFHDVDHTALRRMLLNATLRRLEYGGNLCREGQYNERFYVLIDGTLTQSIGSGGGQSAEILHMNPGSFYGEMAILANQPEIYTITAVSQALVLEIPKTTFLALMEQSEPFGTRIDHIYAERAIQSHISQSPLFQYLPSSAVDVVLKTAELVSYSAGERIFEEGDAPSDMFIVRNGFVKASRTMGRQKERVLLYFREGDVVGLLALLNDSFQSITVTASTRCDLIKISADAVQSLLKRYPEIRNFLAEDSAKAEEMIGALSTQALGKSSRTANTTHMSLSWTGLLDKGVLQSHELLVIDQTVCTDCNNCVDACGRRHGYTRLERSGLQLGPLLFPTACRHCEDPVCLLCSVNGIVRLPNGEITIVEDNCIGCGACADRCPYDNIKMHARQAQPDSNVLNRVFNVVKGMLVPAPDAEVDLSLPSLAVKCDLCAGYNDYACVTACPVGAAFRIDPVKEFGRDDLLIGLEMVR